MDVEQTVISIDFIVIFHHYIFVVILCTSCVFAIEPLGIELVKARVEFHNGIIHLTD